jgi:hypothetical protein
MKYPDVKWSWPARIVLALALVGSFALFFIVMMELS